MMSLTLRHIQQTALRMLDLQTLDLVKNEN
jgi:hypothetical protein